MLNVIEHRGPDNSGVWNDKSRGIYFGHRRLTIIDKSVYGNQPMISRCRNKVLIFNGEIYNFLEIKKLLPNHNKLKGTSDTEVLLEAICFFGIEKCLDYLNGMFAFALWDMEEQTLLIARDRCGEKPLYYGKSNNGIIFGSELKSFKEFPYWDRQIDMESTTMFMKYGYIPSPNSIYQNIKKLSPGHYLVIRNKGKDIGLPVCYWDTKKLNKYKKLKISKTYSIEDLKIELHERILNTVSSRMISDVPIGAFLSSGIDSSMIVNMMQKNNSNKKIKTFSIGQEGIKNEADDANKIAKYLGTDHNELYVNSENIEEIIFNLPEIYDEPFADISQIPTLLVSSLASSKVKVALSGDGGDELFGGYKRHIYGNKIRNINRFIPKDLIFNLINKFDLNFLFNPTYVKNKFDYYFEILNKSLESETNSQFYDKLRSSWYDPRKIINTDSIIQNNFVCENKDFIEDMMYWDLKDYLSECIMTKVDRASMSKSLEVRSPFLDHELIEFAFKIPLELKVKGNVGKWILRETLYKDIPKKFFTNKKKGFDLDLRNLLNKPKIKEWAESIFKTVDNKENNIFNSLLLRNFYEKEERFSSDRANKIWNILVLQSWIIKNR